MRRVSTLFAVLLVLLPATTRASSWLSSGHDAQMTHFNPSERVVGAGNVARLHRVWSVRALSRVIATDRFVFGIAMPWSYDVVVLDAHTGKTLHRYSPAALTLDTTRNDYPVALAYAQGRLVMAAERTVLALDPSSGRVLWRVPGGADQLVIDGGTVYTGKGCQNPCGTLASYAIDLPTGKVRWKHPGNLGQAPAVVGRRVYQPWGAMQSVTRVYDPATGKTAGVLNLSALWAGDAKHAYADIYLAGPTVKAPHSWLSQIGPDGRSIWKTDLGKANAGYPVVAYGMLFASSYRFNPGIVALDARAGTLRWATNVGDRLLLIAANHLIFALSQQHGRVTILNAASGKILRSFLVPGFSYQGTADLMIAGGTLYVVNGSGLVALRP